MFAMQTKVCGFAVFLFFLVMLFYLEQEFFLEFCFFAVMSVVTRNNLYKINSKLSGRKCEQLFPDVNWQGSRGPEKS